jgi:subtilisin family serine protease
MFLYSLKRTKIDLVPADSQPHPLSFAEVLASADSGRHAHDAARVVRASARFFVDKVDAVRTGRTSPRRAPTVYRDASTQLLRCVYREIIVRFKSRVPAARRRAHLADLGLAIVRPGYAPHQFIVRDPLDRRQGDDLIQLANTLTERDADIVYAAPNFVSEFCRTTPPAIPALQWHLKNTGAFFNQVAGQDISAEPAWLLSQGLGIVVAVLDDGVDLNHPALQGQIWTNSDPNALDRHGRNYFLGIGASDCNDPNPKTFNSPFYDPEHNDIHGTPCAGLVGAFSPDGRAFGVAPQCKILPVKILNGGELASELFISQAITYAAGIAPILSCSWHTSVSSVIEEAVTSAASSGPTGTGCAIFCSVGNDSGSPVSFPASLPSAIAVGASTDDGMTASFSNQGPQVDIVAPGGGNQQIFTCDVSRPGIGFNSGDPADGGADGLYTNAFAGTSAAVPIAAGAAAVLLSRKPGLTTKQLISLLEQTADKLPGVAVDASGHSKAAGFGKINLFAALNAL